MAKGTFIQNGDCIDYTNGGVAEIGYHDVVPMVNRIGIAQSAIKVGETKTVCVCGVWDIPAVNDTAFAVGDVLYYDESEEKLTKTAAGNIPAGWCVEAKLQAGTTAKVNLCDIPILAVAGA